METILIQVKLPEDLHWLNVPVHMVGGMKGRGFQVRELVDREEAQKQIDEALQKVLA